MAKILSFDPAKRVRQLRWRNVSPAKRADEVRAVHRHDVRHLSWNDFFAALEASFPGRDVLDTQRVSPRELGACLRLTIEEKMRIEDAETARRRRDGKGGKPFRMSTIHVFNRRPPMSRSPTGAAGTAPPPPSARTPGSRRRASKQRTPSP